MKNESYSKETALFQEALVTYTEMHFKEDGVLKDSNGKVQMAEELKLC